MLPAAASSCRQPAMVLPALTSKSAGRSPSKLPADFTSAGHLEGELPADLEVGPADFAQSVN